MIDYEADNWFGILLRVRGSVLPRLAVRMGIAALIGGGALALKHYADFHLPPVAHALIGVALGLLLVFRTNASYDRFWEGRRLFGQLVNVTRDLMRQLISSVGDTDGHRREIRRLIMAFYYLSVMRLREEDDLDELEEWLTPDEREALESVTHRAPVAATWISSRLARLLDADGTEREVTELRLNRMDRNVGLMLDALGGCERIRFTPVPFAYAQHIKGFLVLFCYTAPFAMVEGMGWWTPVASAVLAFALFGIDEIGVEIEDPFGDDPNDLPLEAIGEGIAKATEEMISAKQPRAHVRDSMPVAAEE